MKFIRKIQKKPRSVRVLILWLISFFVMAAIIIIWLFSFSSKFLAKEQMEEKTEKDDLPSLFKSIEKDFSLFKQGLKASLENIYGE